jgi:hypothetical protein
MHSNPDPSAGTRPNGPPAAAVLAAGIGAVVLGLMTTGAVIFEGLADFLRFDENLGIGSGVGPLSGKTIVATLAYLVSFVGFGIAWRGREVNFRGVFIVAMALLALGFLLTFPPIFEAFEAE